MCGIIAIFRSTLSQTDLRKLLIDSAKQLRHRGPDWSGYMVLGMADRQSCSDLIALDHATAQWSRQRCHWP
eukprot:m.100373 g.100373  ORF g.100373 m.100373 type:complete len:71 (+) comp15122_c0_seq4:122-334(+)